MRFSERKGLKEPKSVLQLNSMDDDLRNGLWDCVTVHYLGRLRQEFVKHSGVADLVFAIWHSDFKAPIDTIDDWGPKVYDKLREYFYKATWHEVYDFIEFVANWDSNTEYAQRFMETCDVVLERDLSGYRFVGGRITEITSKEEAAEIDAALAGPIAPVSSHLKRALELFADKKKPDYRNSIKESISAVEAICQIITKDSRTTLGKALDCIERQGKVAIHPALRKSLDSLYGYTSSADGIRHAMLEETSVTADDARFMLVSC